MSSQARRKKQHLPLITCLLVMICVAIYVYDLRAGAGLAQSDDVGVVGGRRIEGLGRFTLYLPSLEFDDQWYRLVTAGFVHFSAFHLGMNMLLLWQVGRMIEGTFGALTFGTLFFSGVLGGSLGALLIEPDHQAGGASGAVFALLGATAMVQLWAGQNIVKNGMAPLLALNIGVSFLPFVSLGGHLGGLATGVVAGVLIGTARRFGSKGLALVPVAIMSVGLLAAAAAGAVVLP